MNEPVFGNDRKIRKRGRAALPHSLEFSLLPARSPLAEVVSRVSDQIAIDQTLVEGLAVETPVRLVLEERSASDDDRHDLVGGWAARPAHAARRVVGIANLSQSHAALVDDLIDRPLVQDDRVGGGSRSQLPSQPRMYLLKGLVGAGLVASEPACSSLAHSVGDLKVGQRLLIRPVEAVPSDIIREIPEKQVERVQIPKNAMVTGRMGTITKMRSRGAGDSRVYGHGCFANFSVDIIVWLDFQIHTVFSRALQCSNVFFNSIDSDI